MGLSVFIKIHGITGQFLCKVDEVNFSRLTCPAMATPCVLKAGYLRNNCSNFLHICIDEMMKASLFENEIKFKNIQKMREKLKVSTNFLTVPRIWSVKGGRPILNGCLIRNSLDFVYTGMMAFVQLKTMSWNGMQIYCNKQLEMSGRSLIKFQFLGLHFAKVTTCRRFAFSRTFCSIICF